MAKFKPQKALKPLQVQQAVDSDSEDPADFDDDVLPGSDSSGGMSDDDAGAPAAAPARQRGAASDIAALAAAAHQQAAAYAARQKKAAAAAAAAAGGLGAAVGSDDDALMGSDAVGGGSSEEEEEEDDEDEGGGGAAANGSKRPHIYNADGLHEKLEDIAWIDEQPWRESLVVTGSEPTAVEDVDDDLERELAFYNQAMSATAEAITRFQAEGVSCLRPSDYYAEMVKTDEQMARIKDRLMYEQQQIDQATERRKAREAKAYSKQVQAEKQKERTQEKKRQISQVQQLRKQREKSGFAGELDFDAEMSKGGRAGQQQQQQRGKGGQKPGQRFNPADRTPGKKRQLKNAKFGFGGKKRLQKQNDSFSAADMSGYKPGRFDGDGGRKGGGGGGGGKGGGKGRGGPGGPKGGVKKKFDGGAGNRPGKARRQQQRQRKL